MYLSFINFVQKPGCKDVSFKWSAAVVSALLKLSSLETVLYFQGHLCREKTDLSQQEQNHFGSVNTLHLPNSDFKTSFEYLPSKYPCFLSPSPLNLTALNKIQMEKNGSVAACYLSESFAVSLPRLLSDEHQLPVLLVPLVNCVEAGQQAHQQHEGDEAQQAEDGHSQGGQLICCQRQRQERQK